MATLPENAFELRGGCFCGAIRYTIAVPELDARPKIPSRPAMELVPINKVNERFPMITLDHCTSCRRIAGAIIESWFICPQDWVQFTLQTRSSETATGHEPIKATTAEFTVPDESLQSKTYLTPFKSSDTANRTFCGRCGTHLTFFYSGPPSEVVTQNNWPPLFDIAGGTIDREGLEMEGYRPSRQAWESDGIEWVKKLLKEGQKSLSD